MEFKCFSAVDHGMACVVAALEAHHIIHLPREVVGDLAFAFIAPLGADDDEGLRKFIHRLYYSWHIRAIIISALIRVFSSNFATVSGPTPPGTGVMSAARGATVSKSTSPASLPFLSTVDASTTTAPSFTMSPVMRPSFPAPVMSTDRKSTRLNS